MKDRFNKIKTWVSDHSSEIAAVTGVVGMVSGIVGLVILSKDKSNRYPYGSSYEATDGGVPKEIQDYADLKALEARHAAELEEVG